MNELGAAAVTALEAGTFDLRRWGREGMKNLPPLWLLKYLPNMLACHVTILHDCQGPSNTITCGEASGHLAIGEAFRTIQRGQADLAVCGGAETRLNCMGLLRQSKLDRLCVNGNDEPGRAARPFDAARCGGAIGEGAGLLLLEEAEHARRRGAGVYAELVGFGAGSDAYSSWKRHPEGRGQAVAVSKALADAGRAPADVDLIVPNGSAVRDDDRAEAAALRTVFGEEIRRIAVTANKGGLGNCFAGAGALDVIEAALALREQTVPPAVNCDQPDPALGLNIVVGAPRTGRLRCAAVCGTAIGGQAAALVLARCDG
jgi:3-oxoacyl-[acyl-carrier-protein] synthase II